MAYRSAHLVTPYRRLRRRYCRLKPDGRMPRPRFSCHDTRTHPWWNAKLGAGRENSPTCPRCQGIEDYATGRAESAEHWPAEPGRSPTRHRGRGGVLSSGCVLAGIGRRPGRRLAGRESARNLGLGSHRSAREWVSALFRPGDEGMAKEADASHRLAVEAGLAYLEAHATVSRRRIDGEIERVRGEGLVVAAFRQRTSRAGDPQLHTHALVANVVEHIDGGWGAHSRHLSPRPHGRPITRRCCAASDRPAARPGTTVTPRSRAWTTAGGVRRRAEIEAMLAERGPARRPRSRPSHPSGRVRRRSADA
jgi:hypothetical protein